MVKGFSHSGWKTAPLMANVLLIVAGLNHFLRTDSGWQYILTGKSNITWIIFLCFTTVPIICIQLVTCGVQTCHQSGSMTTTTTLFLISFHWLIMPLRLLDASISFSPPNTPNTSCSSFWSVFADGVSGLAFCILCVKCLSDMVLCSVSPWVDFCTICTVAWIHICTKWRTQWQHCKHLWVVLERNFINFSNHRCTADKKCQLAWVKSAECWGVSCSWQWLIHSLCSLGWALLVAAVWTLIQQTTVAWWLLLPPCGCNLIVLFRFVLSLCGW